MEPGTCRGPNFSRKGQVTSGRKGGRSMRLHWHIPVVGLTLFSLLSSGIAVGQGLETKASKDDWEEINFEFNSAILSDGYPTLLRIAELLQQHRDYKIKVEGHTDYVGSVNYNEKLALARANTVKDFLTKY